jgi:hypothetical protein
MRLIIADLPRPVCWGRAVVISSDAIAPRRENGDIDGKTGNSATPGRRTGPQLSGGRGRSEISRSRPAAVARSGWALASAGFATGPAGVRCGWETMAEVLRATRLRT